MFVSRNLTRVAGALAVAGLLFVGAVQARPQDGPRTRPNPVEHMSERLQLTDEQEVKIKAIFDQHFAAHKNERQAKRAEGPSEQERAAMREKMEAERASFDAEIKAILTPDQQAQLEKLKGERKDGPRHGKRGPGKNPMEALSAELNLSADQQAQLKSLFENRMAERKAAREAREAQMTPEQKAEREARHKERKAKMEAERTAIDNEIKAVLTPEQQAEFEKMKAERAQHRGKRHGRGDGPRG